MMSIEQFEAASVEDKMTAIFQAVVKIPTMQKDINDLKESMEFSVAEVNKRVDKVESATVANKTSITDLESSINTALIKRELYDRRWNVLIHGVEDDITKYEDYHVSEEKVRDILRDGLQLENWDTIIISDCHRLPQKPLKPQRTLRSDKKNKRRPLVFKVTTRKDCSAIWDSCKNLQEFNDLRAADEKIYFTKHLPKQLQEQKKALQKRYNTAISQFKNAEWKVDYDAGEINLFIDDRKVAR